MMYYIQRINEYGAVVDDDPYARRVYSRDRAEWLRNLIQVRSGGKRMYVLVPAPECADRGGEE